MPSGIFGTRADLFMDAAILFLTALPILMWTAIRFARARRYHAHRNVQVITLGVVLLVLVLFEIDIRLSGGTLALMARMPARATFVRGLVIVHIVVASLTFLAWLGLACVSSRRLGVALPGTFSRVHRRLGWLTFLGACFLSCSGAVTYTLIYIL